MILTQLLTGQLRPAPPAAVGMSIAKLDAAARILETEVNQGRVTAAAILVARKDRIVLNRAYGVKTDTPFLLASITKPVTAAALMLLVERGKVSLQDLVSDHLKEFNGKDRASMKVRDLLTHTSGLPDMLANNVDLRRRHAPLSEFVKGTMTTPLLFQPRTDFSYQSMGILLAAEIVERISGMPLRDFVQKEFFTPLAMKNTFLGLQGSKIAETAQAQSTSGQDPLEWTKFGWNSPYWRDLGAPWGGLHSTTSDLAIFMQAFLNGGNYNGRRILSAGTVAAMIRDQNSHIARPWGLGWGLSTSPVWAYFGDIVSPRTFGHSGATGTVAWADPETQLVTIILTTRPSSEDGASCCATSLMRSQALLKTSRLKQIERPIVAPLFECKPGLRHILQQISNAPASTEHPAATSPVP